MNNKIIDMNYHGTFNKTEKYFENLLTMFHIGKLDKYGRLGVKYLYEATPKDTGLTARSWKYEIKRTPNGFEIVWKNTNIQNGEEIAMLIQYGHATNHGGYVRGIDYINPALEEVFNQIQEDAQKEVMGIL